MDVHNLIVCIKGAGEMASGIAVRLYRSGITRLLLLEREKPLAVRRLVCFSEAVHDGACRVEGVEATLLPDVLYLERTWQAGKLGVLVDPFWQSISQLRPDVVIDATLAKKNLGTKQNEARLVIGIGPGFTAGTDVHKVVETMRGHHLGRVIDNGPALPNTGIPGDIAGFTVERILRAPVEGALQTDYVIGDLVRKGDIVGLVAAAPVVAPIGGVIRGLIRCNTPVGKGVKIGDIDPRGEAAYADLVSDKARAIGGGVLEAILSESLSKGC